MAYVSVGLKRQAEQWSRKSKQEAGKPLPHWVSGRTVRKQASTMGEGRGKGNILGGVSSICSEAYPEEVWGDFPDDAPQIAEDTVEGLGEKFRESGEKSPMTKSDQSEQTSGND